MKLDVNGVARDVDASADMPLLWGSVATANPVRIMTPAALLDRKPNPTDGDIDAAMSAIICRCGTYGRVRKAIHLASRQRERAKGRAASACLTE